MIINLTQHQATPEQVAQGVVPAPFSIEELLTFEQLPSQGEIWDRARALASIAVEANASSAMIGGAPYLMAPLEQALKNEGIQPLYAFSQREIVEQAQADGSVRKVNVFRHVGFVCGA